MASQIPQEYLQIARERSARGLTMCYDLVYGDRGWTFPPHLTPVAEALVDDRIKNLMVIVTPGGGKSQLTSVLYPAWLLAHDLNETIIGISGAEDLIKGFVKSTKDLIENSHNFKTIFPHVQPNKKLGWSDSSFFVDGRNSGVPDPSYSSYGLWSRELTGKHAKTLIIDDIHTADNTATPSQIEKVASVYFNTLLSRPSADPDTGRGGRIIIVGRRWADNDLYIKLWKSKQYVVVFIPAWRFDNVEDRRLYCDVYVPPNLKCVFSERAGKGGQLKAYYGMAEDDRRGKFFWPGNKRKKEESWQAKKADPALFEAIYQGNPRLEQNALFEKRDFRFRHKISEEVAKAIADDGKGMILQSWDTALSGRKDSNYSAVSTALLIPCSSLHPTEKDIHINPSFHYDVFFLDVMKHRWDFKELVSNMRYFYRRFNPSTVLVERKAAGDPLMSTLEGEIPFTPTLDMGKSKASRITGFGKGASAQGWIRLGHVFWPEDASWMESLVEEFLTFDPSDRHQSDDRVDSIIYLINYAIQLGSGSEIRLSPVYMDELKKTVEIEEQEKPSIKDPLTLKGLTLAADNSFSSAEESLGGIFQYKCKTCKHFVKSGNWCSLNNYKTTIFGSCEKYVSQAEKTEEENKELSPLDFESVIEETDNSEGIFPKEA